MLETLPKLSDTALLAIYRAAKVRPSLRAIFVDPKNMITLRLEVERRGLVRPAPPYRVSMSMYQVMAECDCPRKEACLSMGRCIAAMMGQR